MGEGIGANVREPAKALYCMENGSEGLKNEGEGDRSADGAVTICDVQIHFEMSMMLWGIMILL